MGRQDDLIKMYICITKFKTQGRRKWEVGSSKCNFNNKININNKMKVSGSRLTADSSGGKSTEKTLSSTSTITFQKNLCG